MANFEDEFNRIIFVEGGYVNDPSDAGGETYLGISRKANPYWKGWEMVDTIKQQNSEFSIKIEELNNSVATLTTERDTNAQNYTNAQATISTLTEELETIKNYKLNVETQEKEQVIASYSELLNNEILDSYKSKISEYNSAKDLDKELAYELKQSNPTVFTKTPQYIPKDHSTSGIEAILAKYKK